MLGNISFGELMIIMAIILLLFGAKRLPELAKSLGSSIVEFKKGLNSTLSEIQDPPERPKPRINNPRPDVRKSGRPQGEKIKAA